MNVSPLRGSMPHRIRTNQSHKHISRRRLERYSRNRCPGVRFLESCLIVVSSPSGIFVVGTLQSISLTRHRRYDCDCRMREFPLRQLCTVRPVRVLSLSPWATTMYECQRPIRCSVLFSFVTRWLLRGTVATAG